MMTVAAIAIPVSREAMYAIGVISSLVMLIGATICFFERQPLGGAVLAAIGILPWVVIGLLTVAGIPLHR